MKNRILTVLVSIVFVMTMVMVISTQVSASNRSYTVTIGGARYGLLLEANLISSTTTKGTLSVDHISGPVLSLCEGNIITHAYDSNGNLLGSNTTFYEKYNVSSFYISATYVRSDGGIDHTATSCIFMNRNYDCP